MDWKCKGSLDNGCQEFKVTPVNSGIMMGFFFLFSKYVELHGYKCRVGGELG